MRSSIEYHKCQGHSVTEAYGSVEFCCDGCKTTGSGLRYGCDACHFSMHKFCGECPHTLSSFMHPQHPLQLVDATRGGGNKGLCNLCGDEVEGLFYRCELCCFNIHPLCTKLPEYASVPLCHPGHQLQLQTSSSGCCSVCKGDCTSWRYACRICRFDIHLECISTLCERATETTSRSLGAPYCYASILPHPWGSVHGGWPPHGANGLHYPNYDSPGPHPYHWPMPTHFSQSSFGVLPPPSPWVYHHPGDNTYLCPQNTNCEAQGSGSGSGRPGKGWLSRIMYRLVGNLSIGVLSGLIVEGIM